MAVAVRVIWTVHILGKMLLPTKSCELNATLFLKMGEAVVVSHGYSSHSHKTT